MTREDAKLKFRAEQYYTDDGDLVIPRPYAYDIIDEIFDEHEKELKQAWIDGSNANYEALKKAGKLK